MTTLRTAADAIRWITSLSPEDRVVTWSALTDPSTTAQIAAVVDQTVYMATRAEGRPSYREVADRFGVTVKYVTRAVLRHNARKAARAATTDAPKAAS
jgi:hypothetical protein